MGAGILTRLVSCVSIMKLCTCFSALVSSSFRATTATTSAVQPAPCMRKEAGTSAFCFMWHRVH